MPVRKSSSKRPPWWRRFLQRWHDHGHTDNAAALTFYTVVSLVPLLLVGLMVAIPLLGERMARDELDHRLSSVVGMDAANFLQGIVRAAPLDAHPSAWTTVFVTLMLGYSGSLVLAKLRDTLNKVYEAERLDPARPWLAQVMARFLCAALLLMFGLLLVADSLLTGFVTYFANRLQAPFLEGYQILRGYRMISTYLLLTVAFSLILRILPRRRPHWREALLGGLMSAVLVGSLKSGLDLYLRHSPLASIYGTGLTVLVFVLWLFLATQAFLAGAELSAMLVRRRHRGGPAS